MKNLAPKIKSNLDTNSQEFSQNKEMMLDKISFLDELLDKARSDCDGSEQVHSVQYRAKPRRP